MQNRRRGRGGIGWMLIVILLVVIGFNAYWIWKYGGLVEDYGALAKQSRIGMVTAAYPGLKAFAEENKLKLEDYPQSLLDLLARNPETEEFVKNYPLKKDLAPEIDLGAYVGTGSVPLLRQWDERWGYGQYSGDLMGLTGCGPTCLSMVSLHLLGDKKYTPRYIADFAEENGYAEPGSGSAWTLMSEGGKKLGMDVTEIPLDENRILKNLEVGNPIICILGPGDFTESGHFIVMTGVENGLVRINDPNSRANSAKLWELGKIKDQIRNLWVFQ